MNTKNQNKANFQSLYTCVPIYVHTCILPNKPNYPVHPVNPVKNMALRNKPNLLKAGCRPQAAKLHLQETASHDILLTCNMNT